MNQTLEQLIKLQEIDQRLLEIKEYMGDLPLTVETQENELSSLKLDNLLISSSTKDLPNIDFNWIKNSFELFFPKLCDF